jgi:hypothetical protein
MYKFLEEQSNQRLKNWYQFRQQLESSSTPLDDVAEYFSKVPRVKIYTDPYDQSTWPTAWELIDENEYCQFNIILAVCFTLQLTSQFQNTEPLIKIAIDKINKAVYYLLFVDDKVYGLVEDEWILAKTLPKTLNYLKIYNMPPLH